MAAQQQVALDELTVEQLSQVKQQLDEEVQHLTNSFTALKQAQAKFQEAKNSLEDITPERASHKLLVPLTGSLYVTGKLADPENVLVDVGARYYVEKSTKDARVFYNQKMLELRKSLDQLQPTIEQKNENRQVVMEYLQMKLSSRERVKPQ
ncbi:Prefoldin alpha subunit [Cystobasidium minutum MCA 4210]|uniref:Prefoldin alpha subunit n=1 Tax=Cystobasidium minutum MCA 4210 TaxID=1397322 RepID=UPI0034CD0264|eukprot:jgi/Rhomi1/152266/estExt_Genewise1.C_4_t10174